MRMIVGGSIGSLLLAGLALTQPPAAAVAPPLRLLNLAESFEQVAADSDALGATLVPEETTATSQTWQLPDGTRQTEITAVPVRYQDDVGEWHPIDNEFVDSPANGVAVENAANDVQVELPSDASQKPVKLTHGDAWISFRMEGLDGAPAVDGSIASYADADAVAGGDGAARVEYEATNSGVKESILLDAAPDTAPVYGFRLRASSGLRPELVSGGALRLLDRDDETVFEMPAPFMTDSATEPATSTEVTYGLTELADGSWRLTVRPALDWLTAPERVYPVIVDPTTVTQNDTYRDCWIDAEYPTNTACTASATYVRVGKIGSYERRGLVAFDLASLVPSDAYVSAATLKMYLASATYSSGHDREVVVRQILDVTGSSGTFSDAASWNKRWSTVPWATPGGDYQSSSASGTTLTGGGSGYKSFDATAMVAAWRQPQNDTNRGLLVRSNGSPDNVFLFCSEDNTNCDGTGSAKPPTLTVTYSTPPTLTSANVGFTPVRSTATTPKSASSLTPTLTATATDAEGGTLKYVFEVQTDNPSPTPNSVVATSPIISKTAGQQAAWVTPTLNEHQPYKFRVKSVTDADNVSIAAADLPPFVPFVVDRAPATPTSLTVSPSTGTNPVTTTVTDPDFSAVLSDPDPDDPLTARFEIRNATTKAIVASGTDEVTAAQNGGRAVYTLDTTDRLTPGQSYEFRVGVDDALSAQTTTLTNWSHTGTTWQQFTVSADANLWKPLQLEEPATVWDKGPMLSWSPYREDAAEPNSELVEYQIWRSCKTQPSPAVCTGNTFTTYDATTIPANATPLAVVDAGDTTYRDTSATASTTAGGSEYRYWIVARVTGDGSGAQVKGSIPSNFRDVVVPRSGRMRRIILGDESVPDATIAQGAANTAFPGKLKADTADPTDGKQRGLLSFDLSAIRPGMRVTSASVGLQQSTGSGGTVYLRRLTRDFVESQATWTQASDGGAWTTAGGDADATATATSTAPATSGSVNFADSTGMRALTQGWVNDQSSNHGIDVRMDETSGTRKWADFVPSESLQIDPTALTRKSPRLTIEHTTTSVLDTFDAPNIPRRMVPGTSVAVPVRITNTTDVAFPPTLKLGFTWTWQEKQQNGSFQTKTYSASPSTEFKALGAALAPGESVEISDFSLPAPINSDTAGATEGFNLTLDLWDTATSKFWTDPTGANYRYYTDATLQADQEALIADGECGMLPDGLHCNDRQVETPTSSGLGLEKFAIFDGEETGAGSQALVNLTNGNLVWNYDAMSNPSIGPSFFARLTYNSGDVASVDGSGTNKNTSGGFGWSVQPGTLNRLNQKLIDNGSDYKALTLIDGDGTEQTWRLVTTTAGDTYKTPAGVHLKLTRTTTGPTDERLVFARPDGTKFYFADASDTTHPMLPTRVEDLNGNKLVYGYDGSGRINTITSVSSPTTAAPSGQTMTVANLVYDTAGRIGAICDLNSTAGSRRVLQFGYNNKQQLTSLTDGEYAGSDCSLGLTLQQGKKVFTFTYTDTQNNDGTNLTSVTDPVQNEKFANNASYVMKKTTFGYYDSAIPRLNGWAKQWNDRLGRLSTVDYYLPGDTSQPGGASAFPAGASFRSRVTTNGAASQIFDYGIDGFGRTIQIKGPDATRAGMITAAADAMTRLAWDTDHNVVRMREPNGAVSRWVYNRTSGYPVKQWDPEAVAGGTRPIVMTYHDITATGVTFLDEIKTPLGNPTTFTPDAKGNLIKVRNAAGNTTEYTYNGDGTLATAKDPRSFITGYSYPVSPLVNLGYPRTITPPATGLKAPGDTVPDAPTQFTYDLRGNVTNTTRSGTVNSATVTLTNTVTYDVFGRPLSQTTPGAQGPDRTTSTLYDANDNITTQTAPNGATTSNIYAADDQVLSTVLPDNNTSGRQVRYVYDSIGRLCRQLAPLAAAGSSVEVCHDSGTQPAYATDYTYDNFDAREYRKVSVIDVDDAGNPRAATRIYDPSGDVVDAIDANGNKSTVVYDLNHRPVQQIDAKGFVTRTHYDLDGRVDETTDQAGNATKTRYDKADRITSTTVVYDPVGRDPQSWTTNYAYDAAGNRTAVTRPTTDTRPTAYTARTAYDENNRPIVSQKAYDPNDPQGLYTQPPTTYMKYDVFGRVASTSTPIKATPLPTSEATAIPAAPAGTEWATMAYFDSGDVANSTDPTGLITRYRYTITGQQSVRTLTDADAAGNPGSKSRSMSWNYFPDDSLKSRTDTASDATVALKDNPNGVSVGGVNGSAWTVITPAKGADQQGVDYLVHAAGATTTDSHTWTLTANVAGDYRLEFSCPAPGKDASGNSLETGARTRSATYTLTGVNGSATPQTATGSHAQCGDAPWRSLGRFTLTTTTPLTVKLSPSATGNGNVVADSVRITKVDGGLDHTYDYLYDANGQNTSVKDNTPGALVSEYATSYDKLGRAKRVEERVGSSVPRYTNYGYDANDNLTDVTSWRAADTLNAAVGRTTHYDFDARNQVSQTIVSNPTTPGGTGTTRIRLAESIRPVCARRKGQRARSAGRRGQAGQCLGAGRVPSLEGQY